VAADCAPSTISIDAATYGQTWTLVFRGTQGLAKCCFPCHIKSAILFKLLAKEEMRATSFFIKWDLSVNNQIKKNGLAIVKELLSTLSK